MNFVSLLALVHDKRSAVAFLQQRGVLHAERRCDNGHPMNLHLSEKEDRWRCNIRGCRQQKQLKSGT